MTYDQVHCQARESELEPAHGIFLLFNLSLERLKSSLIFPFWRTKKIFRLQEGQHMITYSKYECRMHFYMILSNNKTFQRSHQLHLNNLKIDLCPISDIIITKVITRHSQLSNNRLCEQYCVQEGKCHSQINYYRQLEGVLNLLP